LAESSVIIVNIAGDEYHIRSNDDPSYVQKVASYVDEKIKELTGASAGAPSTKIIVLAAMNIADEYFHLKNSYDAESASVDKTLAELIKVLEQGLGG
jgi:cell division protein ZapA